MAKKQRSTNHAARAQLAARISLRLSPILERLATMIEANSESDHDVRLALAERAAQLANALLVALHDRDPATIKAAVGVAGTTRGAG